MAAFSGWDDWLKWSWLELCNYHTSCCCTHTSSNYFRQRVLYLNGPPLGSFFFCFHFNWIHTMLCTFVQFCVYAKKKTKKTKQWQANYFVWLVLSSEDKLKSSTTANHARSLNPLINIRRINLGALMVEGFKLATMETSPSWVPISFVSCCLSTPRCSKCINYIPKKDTVCIAPTARQKMGICRKCQSSAVPGRNLFQQVETPACVGAWTEITMKTVLFFLHIFKEP